MNHLNRLSPVLLLVGFGILASSAFAQPGPYKIVNTAQIMGAGGIDYVTADSDDRRLYVPRGNQVLVFDLDTLKPIGSITNARAHGVAIDSKSGHGFCSSSPVVMWDTKSLQAIKTIDVQGRPDGILFEPLTERVYVFSHRAPNATVIDAKDGSIVGTIDLGGSPEQAQSDGNGHLYVDLEDQDKIAVVDVNSLKTITTFDLGGKGGGPGGLGLDARNHLLFVMCHDPATCVVLSAEDGKILATLPIGSGTDGGGFNPATMEAFSSQGDGTLTIIKETGPASFEVEQTLPTKPRAKTCALDTKNNQIVLIALERPTTTRSGTGATDATIPGLSPAATAATAGDGRPDGERRGGRRGFNGPALLDILVVGR